MRVKLQGSVDRASEDRRDRVLVKRLLAGDREAFEEIYRAYEGRVYRLCLGICGNPDDAADAAHETFVTVIKRLPSIDIERLSFGGYLLVAARNACLHLRRRASRAQLYAETPEPEEPGFDLDIAEDPERALLLSDQRSLVRLANSKLAPRQRQALALRELEGMSYRQIAGALGLKENAVAQLISRSRMRLRYAVRGAVAGSSHAEGACALALPLISKQIDDELGVDDSEWLDQHLLSCEACQENVEMMEEAGVTYRSALPALPTAELARRILEDEAIASTVRGFAIQGPTLQVWQRRNGHITSSSRRSLSALTASSAILLVTMVGGLISGGWQGVGASPVKGALLDSAGSGGLIAGGQGSAAGGGLIAGLANSAGADSTAGVGLIDVGSADGTGTAPASPGTSSDEGQATGGQQAQRNAKRCGRGSRCYRQRQLCRRNPRRCSATVASLNSGDRSRRCVRGDASCRRQATGSFSTYSTSSSTHRRRSEDSSGHSNGAPTSATKSERRRNGAPSSAAEPVFGPPAPSTPSLVTPPTDSGGTGSDTSRDTDSRDSDADRDTTDDHDTSDSSDSSRR